MWGSGAWPPCSQNTLRTWPVRSAEHHWYVQRSSLTWLQTWLSTVFSIHLGSKNPYGRWCDYNCNDTVTSLQLIPGQGAALQGMVPEQHKPQEHWLKPTSGIADEWNRICAMPYNPSFFIMLPLHKLPLCILAIPLLWFCEEIQNKWRCLLLNPMDQH